MCFIFVSRKTVIHRSHAIVKHGIWWNFRKFSRLFHENKKIQFDPIFFVLLFIGSVDLPFSWNKRETPIYSYFLFFWVIFWNILFLFIFIFLAVNFITPNRNNISLSSKRPKNDLGIPQWRNHNELDYWPDCDIFFSLYIAHQEHQRLM